MIPRLVRSIRSLRSVIAGALALAALAALAPGLAAQTHPNHVQGFDPEKLYQLDGLENVNLFNGNLNLAIPLGGSYPVGGSLAYGLTLAYSGNLWEWEEMAVPDGMGGNDYFLKPLPRRRSNAGLGWLVSLGRMNPAQGSYGTLAGSYYESPDGNLHELLPSLHADGSTTPNRLYSRDGTYLRYNTTTRELESGDGLIRTFDSTGRLSQLRDRFGNYLSVSYPASAIHAGIQDWKLTDSHGRVHWVYSKPATYYGAVVDRIVLQAFNGTSATYTFQYAETQIARGLTNPAVVGPDPETEISATEAVPLLTQVTLPDGSTYSMPVADYDTGPAPPATSNLSGHLKGMRLPTGGRYEWDWQEYLFPTRSVGPMPSKDPYFEQHRDLHPFRKSVGLAQRRHETASGGFVGRWAYAFTFDSAVPQKEHKVTVTDPLNHSSVYYFSVYVDDFDPQTPEPPGWVHDEYGLPFTRNQADGTSPGRYLSAELKKAGGAVQRKVYVRYERDPFSAANPRLASERTVYLDDASRHADVDSSDFDGLGHYRRIETDGDFPGGSNVRASYTSYNLGNCATCTPGTGTAWVLGTYTFQDVTEGGVTARTEACFAAGTGFLNGTRTLKGGTSRSATDLITRYTADASGNVDTEESFGGDTQLVSTAALCTLVNPGSSALPAAKYKIDLAYQYGSLASSQYQGQSFKSSDYDIDKNTGLVKTSRDTAGLATTYTFDPMGHLTYVKPAQSGWTQYAYFPYAPASGNPAQVWIYRRPNGGGTPLSQEQIRFDHFGRVSLEHRQMADGSFSDRATTYDAAGNLDTRTEWGTSAKTVYSGYDPFGRPGKITPPDGAAHAVTITYNGVGSVARTVPVGTAWNGSAVTEAGATTTETYDRQGRLYRVLEPSNPDGTNATTTYLYDVGNRLKQVSQAAKTTAGTTVTQTRLFGYDNRGFLSSERHPEKGASGNGYVTYGSYDARGHAGTRTDGPHTLRFTYDGAERLTQVDESLGFGLYRPLKSFTFAATNGAGDYRRGKLQVARGYNYPVIGSTQYTVELRETYTYGGKQGRVSQRDTANVVGGSLFESFTQSWTWNDLGDPASVTYPRCTHAACTAATLRTVAPAYTNGFVTAVPGFASSISYHPNGQVNQVTHLNTPTNAATWVSDTYTKDPYNLPRPQKIDAKRGTTLLYQTGLYSYDGAGDVTKMGSSYYLYDRVSRVVSGVQYIGQGGGTGAGGYAFSHTFDGFGNLQAMTTKTGRSTPTSSTTNRLTGSVGYDAAGNLTSWNGNTYQYDALDQMWSFDNGSTEWLYLYTADGERIWAYDYAANTSRWTLRDLDGKVLREYGTAGGWHVERDYVYRDGQLLAAVTPTGTQHFHLDHLGTIRFITNASGQGLAHHAYFPFGEEATSPTQDAERMKFTGHERDLGNLGSPADDLDYMHARFYNPQTGRFTRVDPMNSADPRQPQSWNRYTYARDNPLKFIDPDGREIQVPEALRESVSQGLQGSADFADIFQTLDALPASEVLVTFGPFQAHSPPGSDAIQSQKIFETGTIEVAISLRVGDTGPPRIGHELYHVLELYQARKSLKKRFQSGEQGITRSSAGYESRAATQAERRIRNQMDESRRKQRQQQKEQNAVDGLNSLSAGREFLDYLIYSPY